MEKTAQQSKRLSYIPNNFINTWSAQCGKCFKWRVIPTQEEYEEIRSKLIEDPFLCSKKNGISCDDPADIEYDKTRTWVIDKPNLPKTPRGFKRTVVVRKNYTKTDCYYDFPNAKGKRLRSLPDIVKFLDENPEYKKNASVSDFSFVGPKIMGDTVPANVTHKV